MEEWLYIQNEVAPALLKGFWVSLSLIIPAAACGLAIGIIVGVLRVYGGRPLMTAANLFVTLFRGIPLVVQLFIWYFGLPYVSIYLTPYTAAVLGFSLCSGAYHSEYIRGALLSIKRGQILAAQSLGFTTLRMISSVILPQAIRRALPGCGNEIIYLIKYSSLAYMITCIELTGQGKILASNSFKYTEIFLIIGACYLLMTSVAGLILGRVEERLRLPGFGRHRI
ncbi:MAG: amino acid ABC transporter permease [Syntrophales bacterium]